MKLYQKLKQKGWSEAEIKYSMDVIEKAKEKKSKSILFLDKIIFWVFLILTIFGTMITSTILIPFLFFVKPLYMYLSISIIAIGFGSILTWIITDLDQLEKGIQILPGIFLPALGLINSYIIVTLTNILAKSVNYSQGMHNPIYVAIIYTLFFILPYFVWKYIFQKYL